MLKKLLSAFKKYGIIGALKKRTRRFLGIEKQQEAIDSLYYFMNTYLLDASSLPPAKDPDLRVMQKCDSILLQIFDKICSKHNLTYWIDFGTLLGGMRHRGFIPWDDDMDVSMLRKDYDQLLVILKSELDSDFDIIDYGNRIGIGYMHNKTGIWCDVFPVDEYVASKNEEVAINNLKKDLRKYRKFYEKNFHKLSYEELQRSKKKIIKSSDKDGTTIIYHGREFDHQHPNAFYTNDEIFPLSTITFEGAVFPAPQKTHEYLSKIFGVNYMQIPRGGILHHDMGRGPLSTWAKKNSVNMIEVLSSLEQFLSAMTIQK